MYSTGKGKTDTTFTTPPPKPPERTDTLRHNPKAHEPSPLSYSTPFLLPTRMLTTRPRCSARPSHAGRCDKPMARHRHRFAEISFFANRATCMLGTFYKLPTVHCKLLGRQLRPRKKDTHVIITRDCLVTIRNTNQSNLVLSKLGPTSMLILRSLECTNVSPLPSLPLLTSRPEMPATFPEPHTGSRSETTRRIIQIPTPKRLL